MAQKSIAEVHPMPPQRDPGDAELSLRVRGSMSVRLDFESAGLGVVIGFEDGCVKVKLSNGTEFKLPVVSSQSKVA